MTSPFLFSNDHSAIRYQVHHTWVMGQDLLLYVYESLIIMFDQLYSHNLPNNNVTHAAKGGSLFGAVMLLMFENSCKKQ